MQTIFKALLFLSLLFIFSACRSETALSPAIETSKHIVVPLVDTGTLSELRQFFKDMNYSWNKLEHGVPPFILGGFPDDLDDSVQIQKKKRSFFLGLLPMVLLANEEIREERRFLMKVFAQADNADQLSETAVKRLMHITHKYRLRGDPLRDHRVRNRLVQRVDTIPPALVLAQAANESAWGSSRFAKLGNNLFGQWTFKPGTGIVPEDRPEGATYEVKKFANLFESVRSYLLNLNTHSAYLELREIRLSLRNKNLPVTGRDLAKGLLRYSTRGEHYVSEIRAMIRQNRLHTLNDAVLRRPGTDILNAPATAGHGLLSTRRQIVVRISEAWIDPQI